MNKSAVPSENTRYGFNYGAAEVTRMCCGDPGWVVLGLKTRKSKNPMQIYVTKTGKVRVWGSDGVEWKPSE